MLLPANQFGPLGITDKSLPDIANTCTGTLLIVGSGRCVWDDLEHWEGSCETMCLNDMGMHFPAPYEHWYSNDCRMLLNWFRARRPSYARDFKPPELHSCFGTPEHKWPWPAHGSSGLGAIYTGLGLGYDKVILAGIPLDSAGHYFDPPWVRTNFSLEASDRIWNNAKKVFRGRVRSLSGRSRELLGGPENAANHTGEQDAGHCARATEHHGRA